MRERKPFTRNDWTTIGLLILFLGVVSSTVLLIPVLGPLGMGLFLLTAVGGLAGLVFWHASTYAYVCRSCGQKFAIGFWQEFISPHTFRTKLLRCPHCGRRTWAAEAERD